MTIGFTIFYLYSDSKRLAIIVVITFFKFFINLNMKFNRI